MSVTDDKSGHCHHVDDDALFQPWCDHMREIRRLGPGCGAAEFETPTWRVDVQWRMRMGYRPGLVALFHEWIKNRERS